MKSTILQSVFLLSIVIFIIIPHISSRDPYEILGVRRDATMDQVKQAYRSLTKRVHPDKNASNEDAKRLLEIHRAFDHIREHRSKLENQAGTATRITWRIIEYSIRLMQYLTALETASTIILFVTSAGIICIISYHTRNSSLKRLSLGSSVDNPDKIIEPETSLNQLPHDRMKLIELKSETYNGLVRLLKPGQRSIVLLCDQETKNRLISRFKGAVWPYRRNKSLLFGYLCLDKNLDWYRSLLEQVLGQEILNLNKKYCIGTVLSLNGFKRYFRLYHTKHNESLMSSHIDEEHVLEWDPDNFDRCIEDGRPGISPYITYTVDNLLDGLPSWLEKTFDGLTKRYLLDEWPDDMR